MNSDYPHPAQRKIRLYHHRNTGFVGSQQRYCAVKVLNNRIEKLTISRTSYGASFAEQLSYLLIGKQLIPLWTMQTIKPHVSSCICFSSKAGLGKLTLLSILG